MAQQKGVGVAQQEVAVLVRLEAQGAALPVVVLAVVAQGVDLPLAQGVVLPVAQEAAQQEGVGVAQQEVVALDQPGLVQGSVAPGAALLVVVLAGAALAPVAPGVVQREAAAKFLGQQVQVREAAAAAADLLPEEQEEVAAAQLEAAPVASSAKR